MSSAHSSAGNPRSAASFRPSHLYHLREISQVAAVCYRRRNQSIEFLLVQTRGGRWTFPKGGVEPGLTHAQTAALEAFEEAGVHGRMEEAPFARYLHLKRGKTSRREMTVQAHLCEVTRLSPPQEAGRNRTWFSADKTKQQLRQDRANEHGRAMARVVDRAVSRIQESLRAAAQQPALVPSVLPPNDALQKVQVEAVHSQQAKAGYVRRSASTQSAIELAVSGYLREVFAGKFLRRRPKAIGNAEQSPLQLDEYSGAVAKVTSINRS